MSSGVPFESTFKWCGLEWYAKGRYYRGSPAVYNPPDLAHPGDPDEWSYTEIKCEGQKISGELFDAFEEGEFESFEVALSDTWRDYPEW